jgi:hypothetical protein
LREEEEKKKRKKKRKRKGKEKKKKKTCLPARKIFPLLGETKNQFSLA